MKRRREQAEKKGGGRQEASREKAGWAGGGRAKWLGCEQQDRGGCRPQAHLSEGHWGCPGPGSHRHTPSPFLHRGSAVSRVGKE